MVIKASDKMQPYPELMEPMLGFRPAFALPIINPFFESSNPAANLFCPATSSPFAHHKAYVSDQLAELNPAADLIYSPAGNIIPDPLQFHGELQCLYGCSNYFPEATRRASTGGDEERRSGGGAAKQSVAARERRRKITVKTQELGKLIPGSQKMNTAQMLQAAFKYVKFLQAQLALLQQMASFQRRDQGWSRGVLEAEQLPVLLASSAIQEKLYSEEKCLAPKQFLQQLDSLISRSFD